MAVPGAFASFTTINVSADPTHATVLNGLYGGTFTPAGAPLPNGYSTAFSNGSTVVTRMDDDGLASLLHILFNGPGTADDDLWGDGAATILATAKYADAAQEFGYNLGAGYVKLVEVTGGGFAASGMVTAIFNNNAVWQWARADDSTGSPVNVHQSDEPSNADGLDHMVTYQVVGAPGVSADVRVWLLFFEAGNGGASDRDFNDLAIELRVEGCTSNTQCNDNLACTLDLCGPKRFCINAPIHSRCADTDICTTDTCSTLLGCVNAPRNCSDNNACTNERCDPVLGCVSTPDDCDDGIDCTTDDCDPVSGCANVPDDAVCDDQNDCTMDSCDAANGCVNSPAPWGAACGNQMPQGACDRADVCDGFGSCGPYYQPSTLECRAAAGVCGAAEFCTGSSADCPSDGFLPVSIECRAAEGVCDVAEFCTGDSADCSVDGFEPNTKLCRAASSECDVAEFCSGADVNCPGDGFAPADRPCSDDGDECTLDRCDGGGVCAHAENADCGACCAANDACRDRVLPATCTVQGGTSSGAASVCLGDSDGDGVDELCDQCPGVDDSLFGVTVCRDTGAPCESDSDCGPNELCVPACNGAIPTISQWGMVILTLALLTAGKLYFGRQAVPVGEGCV